MLQTYISNVLKMILQFLKYRTNNIFSVFGMHNH